MMVIGVLTLCNLTVLYFLHNEYLYSGLPSAIENDISPIRHYNSSNHQGHFWEHEPKCFHIDYICHANGEWFYDLSIIKRRQYSLPSITYESSEGGEFDHRIHFSVLSPPLLSGMKAGLQAGDDNLKQCYSQTPYHVVIQSVFNDMMGEFYIRSILGLNQWMRKLPPQSDEDLQFYVHFNKNDASILDGHRMFLGGLPQNGKIDDFLSLVQDKSSCQCFQKLVFCGYSVSVDQEENKLTFEVAENIGHPHPEATLGLYSGGPKGSNPSYQDFRQDLLTRYAEKDPMLHQKVREYRLQILLRQGVALDNVGDIDEWKIVGLADRKYRRIWLDIDESTRACDSFLLEKVICVKVNVEEADSVEEQLLMHMSLNVFMGIHGSQFTNAVLLPQQSFVVELLPWIPDYAWGVGWAVRTDHPTPMGTIFHDTDLHHLGFVLDRGSVPLCNENRTWDEEQEKKCFQEHNNEFRWDRRNFNVRPSIITKFISSFLLVNNTHCDSIQTRASESGFVLYNTFCSRGNETSTEHYYMKETFEEDDEEAEEEEEDEEEAEE